jgi:crossover junction endodeoxyribonuclease RusA
VIETRTSTLVLAVHGVPTQMLLSSNQRLHWRRKAIRTKYWRELAGFEARQAMGRGELVGLDRARIVAVMTFPTMHRRDVHNYQPTLKPIVDGLVDAGVLPDDDDTHLEGPDLRRNPDRGACSIRLEITDLGGPS